MTPSRRASRRSRSAETPTGCNHVEYRWGAKAFFELLGLWSITVAYPILSAAVSGIEGLVSMRADRLDVIVFVLLIVVAVPLAAFLLEWTLKLIAGTKSAVMLHCVLVGLFALPVLVRIASDLGPDGAAGIALGILLAVGASVLFLRTRFVRSLVSVLSFATPVVLVIFAASTPVQSLFTPESRDTGPLSAQRTPPVVYLILDEFPLAAIEREEGVLDSDRFPNFARLSEQATWYSRARTESDSTVLAVPFLVSGAHRSDSEPAPGLADYPDNFMTVLDRAGYDVYGSEWMTDFCPHDLCPRERRFTQRFVRFLTNGLTFGRPLPLPGDKDLELSARLREHYDARQRQPARIDELVTEIRSGESNAIFSHLMLPHAPWVLLPDGRRHNAPKVMTEFSGSAGRIHQDVQRMLLQIRYVDRAIGRVIDAMRQARIWDESLFVLVADHGAVMEGGGSRRVISRENAAWIAPVPLFIKYPNQAEGRIVSKPVTTGDVFPTILDEIGIDLDIPGRHHLESPEARKTEHRVSSIYTSTVEIGEDELQSDYRAILVKNRDAFPEPDVFATDGGGNLLNREVRRVEGLRPVEHRLFDEWRFEKVRLGANLLPIYVAGVLEGPGLSEQSSLVIAINGRIAATMKPWEENGSLVFGTVADPRHFINGANEVEILLRDTP